MLAPVQRILFTLLALPVLVLGFATAVQGDTIYVCWDGSGDYLTIQQGIDAADEFDEVVVCDGTYIGPLNKNLDFGGKLITVRSANGPENCIIDCEGAGCGFYFHESETLTSVVDGFTITNGHNGYWDDGGAIYCSSSSPTIRNCIIWRNTATDCGGGLHCNGASPYIDNCTIAQNMAGDSGGGVSCDWNSNPTLTDCVITQNWTEDYNGAGMHCANDSDATLMNCMITENTATYGGGVFFYNGSTATLTNCVFAQNTASNRAGAVACASASATITNCILWGDWASEGAEMAIVGGSTLTISYSDAEGGEEAVYVSSSTLNWGEGNIDADPEFAFGAGDYHIMSNSPCVDAGTNTPEGGLPSPDPDGNVRPLDGDGDDEAVADMGVYEFNREAPSIAVWPDALWSCVPPEGAPNPEDQILSIRNCGGGTLNWQIEGANTCDWLTVSPDNGQSSGEVDDVTVSMDAEMLSEGDHTCVLEVSDPNAVNDPRTVKVTLHVGCVLDVPSEYDTIQEAIDAAVDCDRVLVADGTYTGQGNKNLDFSNRLPPGQTRAITVRSESGPDSCAIDCDGSGRGFYFHSGETEASVVEGFKITRGHRTKGGAMYCEDSSPTIINCIMHENEGDYEGGGMYNSGISPTLINCTFSSNHGASVPGETHGGGMYNTNSNVTLINCTFTGNTAGHGLLRDPHDGGAMCNETGSNVELTNCIFINNTANNGNGGGIANRGGSQAVVTNCTFAGNVATDGGVGGAICIKGNGSVTVANSILWGDTPDEIYEEDGSSATVTYSDVQGGWGDPNDYNIDQDPLFADPDNDDYHLDPNSPCIDVGSNDAVPEGITTDLEGDPRIVDGDRDGYCDVDMGAYEYQWPCVGDADGDLDTDHSDMGIVLAHWGQTEEDPEWDPMADLDCDGSVGHTDLGIVLADWGCGT